MNIDRACALTLKYADTGMKFGLAIHKAAQETPFTTTEISREFAKRRIKKAQEKRRREEAKNKVPDWVLKGKDWD